MLGILIRDCATEKYHYIYFNKMCGLEIVRVEDNTNNITRLSVN